MIRRSLRAILAVGSAAVVLAACGGGSAQTAITSSGHTPSPASPQPTGGAPGPGWTLQTSSSAGVSIYIPPQWRSITPTNPDIAIQAVDGVSAEAGLSVNVISKSVPGTTLALFAQVNVAQLKASGHVVGAIAQSNVTLPAGPAVRIQYTDNLTQGSFDLIQYLLVHGGRGIVMTFGGPTSLSGVGDTAFQQMAESLRFL